MKNDLRKPTIEEIGSRATIYVLKGIKNSKRDYLEWVISNCSKAKKDIKHLFTDDAVDLLVEKLVTPLQFEQYLKFALEEAYQISQKPITQGFIESILSRDIESLEAKLTRYGYNVKLLSDILNLRPAEMKAFVHGQLAAPAASALVMSTEN